MHTHTQDGPAFTGGPAPTHHDHAHTHDGHTHTHDGDTHTHSHEVPLDPNVPATPSVLEIGGDIGAAVIYVPEALNGREIEIKPVGTEWKGKHTGVRRRPGVAGQEPVVAALFYGLTEGEYELRVKDGGEEQDPRSLQIVGGHVTEQNW